MSIDSSDTSSESSDGDSTVTKFLQSFVARGWEVLYSKVIGSDLTSFSVRTGILDALKPIIQIIAIVTDGLTLDVEMLKQKQDVLKAKNEALEAGNKEVKGKLDHLTKLTNLFWTDYFALKKEFELRVEACDEAEETEDMNMKLMEEKLSRLEAEKLLQVEITARLESEVKELKNEKEELRLKLTNSKKESLERDVNLLIKQAIARRHLSELDTSVNTLKEMLSPPKEDA
jgi:hypothetical protein